MRTTVCRRATFNAAHRLFNPDWDEATNDKVFGLCNNPNFHGHNYTLFVKITGEINPQTGYVMDLKIVNDLIKELVIEPFDHNNLNLDVPEFAALNPTAENIAIYVWNKLEPLVKRDNAVLYEVEVWETKTSGVIYNGK